MRLCLVPALTALGLSTPACAENLPIPIPDEFDGAFVQGTVCMPHEAHTGSGTWDESASCVEDADCPAPLACSQTAEGGGKFCSEPALPITFDTCLYRCVKIDAGSVSFRWYWSCSGGACVLVPLVTAHLLKVENESKCDGRDLEDPPADECYDEHHAFTFKPPYGDSGYVEGPFVVDVPYLDMDAAERVLDKIDAGESTSDALAPEIEHARYPERQFNVEFKSSHPVVASDSQPTGGDCVEIPLP